MPLTLVTGRANAGKTGIIYGALRRALDEGLRPVLLLPAYPDVVRARSELGGEGVADLEITRFDAYLESLWDLLGDGRAVVSHVERDALLRRLLAEGTHEGMEVSGSGRGLRRVLARLIEHRAESPSLQPRPARGQGAAVVGLVLRYEALLADRGLVEREEAFRLIAESPAITLADPLAVHRFSDLTTAQERFVLAAAAAGADVLVSLPWEPGLAAAAGVDALATRLSASAKVVSARDTSHATAPELARLEKHLFSRATPEPARGAVDLVVAQGRDAEATAIATVVSEHLADGVPPERVAVAFRDVDRHIQAVRRAFALAGIPADFDVLTPAATTPFGRALLHLWAFVGEGMSRVDLVAFLRTPFSGAEPETVDGLDARWRAARIDQGQGLLAGLRECPVALARIRIGQSLVGEVVDAAAATRWRELADGLLSSAYPGDTPVLRSDAVLDARVHGVLLSAVASLAGLGGEATSGDVIESVRDSLVAPISVERPGHVQVMSVERLRSRRFEAVVLGGLTASEFPQNAGEDASASEMIGDAMTAFGLEPKPRSAAARERLLYYEAVTRARRRLTLVRQESDDEGAECAPSVFWDETLDLYRDPIGGPDPEGVPLLRRMTTADLGGPAVEFRRSARGEPQGQIGDSHVRARLARSVVSVSDIESYLSCPYRWFHTRVVAPGRLDVEIDARTRGTVAHAALAEFYRRLGPELGADRVRPDNVDQALALADQVTVEALAGAPRTASLEEEMALAGVKALVRGLVERDARFLPGWRPVALEWSFGMKDDDEPHDFGDFLLRGRVDRVDEGPGGLVVVDYKTGAGGAVPQAKMLSAGKVQMPLYAAVVSSRMGRPVVGGLYRSLSKRNDRGFVLDAVNDGTFTRTDVLEARDIESLIEGAVSLAAEAVEGMKAGIIEPKPAAETCGICVAAGFCEKAIR